MQTAYLDLFDIKMTLEQAKSASHPGPCDHDVAVLLQQPNISKQLNAIADKALVEILSSWSFWDELELMDRAANEARILWLAAGEIIDNQKD